MDDRLLHALHVRALRHAELHPDRAPHHVFQTSTLAALLDGRYDGDVTLGEVLAQGDLGLGTLDALDGELIVVEGRAWRADADGFVRPVGEAERTPFAVVAAFTPGPGIALAGPLDLAGLLAAIDADLGDVPEVGAVRVDGRFATVHARSVPRQSPPYPPLAEVAARQHEFDLHGFDGTLVGFRFPADAADLNVPGHHLHVVDAARERGGHVLDLVLEHGTLQVDESADLVAELPAGIRLEAPAPDAAMVRRIEGESVRGPASGGFGRAALRDGRPGSPPSAPLG